ncbi:MerR family transcriptional regulator [Rhodococcus jostii]|uniref:MerR family transcriptional regulator n=1 Tax=Rhodococcus jostii TaxID=132919 RepID=UPI003656E1CC
MRIGELADRTGASPRSLRYYEQKGLLSAERTHGGQREYDEGAVDRVHRIQELFRAGMHSPTIKRILPCTRDKDGGPSATADAQLAADLTRERERIQQHIVDLQTSLRSLDQVIDAATQPQETPD